MQPNPERRCQQDRSPHVHFPETNISLQENLRENRVCFSKVINMFAREWNVFNSCNSLLHGNGELLIIAAATGAC